MACKRTERLQIGACAQMQEAARDKVMRAFKSALRYMDEDTLMSKVADHLQLQASPCEIPQAAPLSDGSLQAPQSFFCPKKARSRRCRRPASAASQGMCRVPSQGVPSMGRPLSAPAERSGSHCGSPCILACAEAAVDMKLAKGQQQCKMQGCHLPILPCACQLLSITQVLIPICNQLVIC